MIAAGPSAGAAPFAVPTGDRRAIRLAVLCFCLWGGWLSAEYWAFHAWSYQRQHDAAEANTAFYTALPELSARGLTGLWHPLAGAGVDALANLKGDIVGVEWLFRVAPAWAASGILLWLQTWLAGVGAFVLLRRHFAVGIRVALLGGAYYALLPAANLAYSGFAPWHGWYLPGLPFALVALAACTHVWWGPAGAVATGVVLAIGAPTASGLPVLPVIAWWLLAVAPSRGRRGAALAACACAAGFLIVKAPVIVALATAVDESHRVIRAGIPFGASSVPGALLLSLRESFAVLRDSIWPLALALSVRGVAGRRADRYLFAILLGSLLVAVDEPTRRVALMFGRPVLTAIGYFEAAAGLLWPTVLILVARRNAGDAITERILIAIAAIGYWVAAEPLVRWVVAPYSEAVASYQWNRFALFVPWLSTAVAALALNRFWIVGNGDRVRPRWLVIALLVTSVGINLLRERERELGSHHTALLAHPVLEAMATATRGEPPFRVATFADANERFGGQHPAFAWAHGIETADLYLQAYPLRYHHFWSAVAAPALAQRPDLRVYFDQWGNRAYLFNPDAPPFFQTARTVRGSGVPFNLDLLSLANVRFVITRVALADARLRLRWGSPGTPMAVPAWTTVRSPVLPIPLRSYKLFVYENMDALPRFFVVHQWQAVRDGGTALSAMASVGAAALARTAYVETEDAILDAPPAATPRTPVVRMLGYAADAMTLETDTTHRGVLVITQSYSRYWMAEINGVPARVFPVDHAFQGLVVPAGTSRVLLRYQPPAAIVVRWQRIAYGGLLGVAGILIVIQLLRCRHD